MLQFIRKIPQTAYFWSLIAVGLRFIGLLAVFPLLLRKIPSEKLGVYYVILSAMSLLSMIDVGISASFSRALGYAWAGAKGIRAKGVESNSDLDGKPNLPLVSDLFHTMKWILHRTATIGFILFGVGGTLYMIHIRPHSMGPSEILALWFVYLGFAIFNYASNIWMVLLLATNSVRDYQIFLGLSIAVGYLFSVFGLILGFGLWAMSASFGAQILVMRICSEIRGRSGATAKLFCLRGKVRRDYFVAIWPNSWRFGLAQVAGSVMTSLPVLISSAIFGLTVSASIGVTLQIVNAIAQMATIGFLVKVPLFNILRASGDLKYLGPLFMQRFMLYIYLYIFMGLTLMLVGTYFFSHVIKTKTPLLEGLPLFLCLLFIAFEGVQAMFQRLLLSINEVPFWRRSIFASITLTCVSFVCAKTLGLFGLLSGIILWKFVFFDAFICFYGISSIKQTPSDFLLMLYREHFHLFRVATSFLYAVSK